MDNRPIGVFDSGLGGLTAMRELIRTLPNENILYFGDTGRVPTARAGRGDSSAKYAKQDMNFLIRARRKSRVGRLWYGQLCCP